MTHPGPAFRLAAILSVTLLLGTLPALAGWQDDYKTGLAALDEGKLNKAEKSLRAALARKSKEKANAIKASGMFFEPYLPHFYLGMTLFRQENYSEAIEEFEISESMKVVQKQNDQMAQLTQSKRLARQLADAQRSTERAQAPPQPPPAEPAPVVAQKDPPAKPTATPTKSTEAAKPPSKPPTSGKTGGGVTTAEPLKPSGPDPALTGAINAAAGEIAAAQKLKASAGQDLKAGERAQLDAASKAIRDAKSPSEASGRHDALRKLTSDLSARVDQRRKERVARADLDKAKKSAAATVAAGKSLLSRKSGELKNSEKSRLSREISAVESAGTAPAVDQAARTLRSDMAGLEKALTRRAAAPPPADDGQARAAAAARARQAYATAVEAYFKGDFDAAVSGLETASDDISDDPEIHAMMGSAFYKRYILTRSKDESLRSRAEAAFRSALAIRADYKLDPRYYPPKIIAFFDQVASGRAGSSGPSSQ